MNKQVSSFFHAGAVAGMLRTEVRTRDLGIAVSGSLRDGVYTSGPIFAGIGGGSVPARWRLKT